LALGCIGCDRKFTIQSNPQQVELAPQSPNYSLSFTRPIHVYSKGEIIPQHPQKIWQVCKGLVKLTTFGDTGEQMVIGLAGPKMLFGSALTSLSIYQVTPLSASVELVEFSFAEITASPELAQSFLPQINQRLKQTESLLAIFAKRRLQERLEQLLLLLKQEIGEPTTEGTRLTVRLTHEDLANTCCTTRVTMTRLLGELQQQGKIIFDRDRHIILI
jgi:CRP-like cAMP-binding protein